MREKINEVLKGQLNHQKPLLVRSGLSQRERELLRDRVDSMGKCCEGGSEGWTG